MLRVDITGSLLSIRNKKEGRSDSPPPSHSDRTELAQNP